MFDLLEKLQEIGYIYTGYNTYIDYLPVETTKKNVVSIREEKKDQEVIKSSCEEIIYKNFIYNFFTNTAEEKEKFRKKIMFIEKEIKNLVYSNEQLQVVDATIKYSGFAGINKDTTTSVYELKFVLGIREK